MKEEKPQTTLPENATRELKPGEEYRPLLQPEKNYPEVTPWSVSIGLVMTCIIRRFRSTSATTCRWMVS